MDIFPLPAQNRALRFLCFFSATTCCVRFAIAPVHTSQIHVPVGARSRPRQLRWYHSIGQSSFCGRSDVSCRMSKRLRADSHRIQASRQRRRCGTGCRRGNQRGPQRCQGSLTNTAARADRLPSRPMPEWQRRQSTGCPTPRARSRPPGRPAQVPPSPCPCPLSACAPF